MNGKNLSNPYKDNFTVAFSLRSIHKLPRHSFWVKVNGLHLKGFGLVFLLLNNTRKDPVSWDNSGQMTKPTEKNYSK